MASITITVQSLLNAALYDSYTLDDTTTVGDLKTTIQTDTGVDPTWYVLAFNDVILADDGATLASYSIIDGSVIRSGNVIGYLETLQDRQIAKLNLAVLDRTYVGNPYNTYDINLLPSQYIGNVSTPNEHPDGLIEGRPWVINVTPTPTPALYLNANNNTSYPGTGTTWYDLSGNTNDASLFNGVTFDNGISSVNISTSDLAYVTSGPISGNTYTTTGWDYIVFTDATLYNELQTLTGGADGPYPMTWSEGSTTTSGFVYVEFSGNPNEFQFCPCTGGMPAPAPGTYIFPATLSGTSVGAAGLVFDAASGQWASTPNLGSMSTWTIESWFSTTADLSTQITAIVTNEWNYDASLNYTMGTIGTPTANVQIGFYDKVGPGWHYTDGFTPTTNTWYHVVGTYDGSTIKQYVMGSEQSTLSYSGTPTSGGLTRIASRWDSQVPPGDFFPGEISLVRIYNSALAPAQVYQNYVDTAPTYLPSISFNFSALEGPPYIAGSTIEDQTGSINSPTGFTINIGTGGADPQTGSGVAFTNLTSEQITFLNASSYSAGYVWTAYWGPGSTYASTPVAVYYDWFGPNTLVFWILDPSDETFSTPVPNGTFNFPALFVEGTTPTDFHN
jgi:hypothetical protein